MNDKAAFAEAKKAHLETLKQYVPVVDRVHGGSHPEFHEVRSLFETLAKKMETAGADRPDLEAEFSRLREVTDDYTVPEDVCESYEAVYAMLADLDKAYRAQPDD